jgi:hypothetical protein
MLRSLIAAALIAAPLAVQAENDEAPLSGRTLNGHPFLPMSTVVQPFVNTEFQSNTAVGTAKLNFNEQDLKESGVTKASITGGDDVALGTLLTGMGAQIGIADVLALRLAVLGTVRTGANGTSAFLLGATAGPDFGIGASVKVIELEFMQLSLGADVTRAVTWQISPQALLNAVIERFNQTGTLVIPRNAAYVQTDTLSFVPGASFAIAPHPVVGFVTSLQLSVDQQQIKGQKATTDSSFIGSLGMSLNFQPLGAPVGAVAALSRNFGSDASAANTTYEFGFFPVSLSHFALGLEAYLNTTDVGPLQVVDPNDETKVVGRVRESVDVIAGQVLFLYSR